MRRIFFVLLLLGGLFMFGLPHIVNQTANRSAEPPAHSPQANSAKPEQPVKDGAVTVRLYRHATGTIETIPLDDYVTGVVAAEMPAEFPVEALKAQAVAARTYIVKRMLAGGLSNNIHPGADTCDDPAHAQAWLPAETLKERWGLLKYYRYYYKIRVAVDDTSGVIITYQGQPIDPVFHSSCGGHTENSEDVWKFAVPYLRGVVCPYDQPSELVCRVTMPLGEVEKALGVNLSTAVSSGANGLFQVVNTTASGRPKTLLVSDKRMAAVDLRQKLGLRSTNFTARLDHGEITFTTVGYGHGVGMCQYGAKGLAEHGQNYAQIIKHYYTGVEISKL
ncbi:MAG: stage II sporulation protein D [Firmicutes bacterium]|nr:stage II sporulation protein D [Bacillota bacterium]